MRPQVALALLLCGTVGLVMFAIYDQPKKNTTQVDQSISRSMVRIDKGIDFLAACSRYEGDTAALMRDCSNADSYQWKTKNCDQRKDELLKRFDALKKMKEEFDAMPEN